MLPSVKPLNGKMQPETESIDVMEANMAIEDSVHCGLRLVAIVDSV